MKSSLVPSWVLSAFFISTLAVIYILAPEIPVDPWGLFKIKKIISMILALSLIHLIGAIFIRNFGIKLGLIISGFIGGFVSSTASTANLARRSLKLSKEQVEAESIIFLSATLAMLIEAALLVAIGNGQPHWEIYAILAVPIITTLWLIYSRSRKIEKLNLLVVEPKYFDLIGTVKLTVFIVLILTVSKLLQILFGKSGLIMLTFLISLFEIHGSIIANIQIHESGTIDSRLLLTLICVSVLASYLSKLFIIISIGNPILKKIITQWTLFVVFSFIVTWAIIYTFS